MLSFLSICAGETFDLNSEEIAAITSSVFLGEILGATFWGPFADVYGRKTAYIYACLVITVGSLLTGFSPNYICLLIFGCMVGFGVGGATISFDLLAEFMPGPERGHFLVYIEIKKY